MNANIPKTETLVKVLKAFGLGEHFLRLHIFGIAGGIWFGDLQNGVWGFRIGPRGRPDFGPWKA